MRELPEYCSQEGLAIPDIPSDVAAWLERHDPEALETIRAVGVPRVVRLQMRALPRLQLSNRYADWVTTAGGSPIGRACMIGENSIEYREPFRDAWVIAEDGRLVLCSHRSDGRRAHERNTSYAGFLVFETALSNLPPDDEASVFAVLPALGRIDPWAFESEYSPWPRYFAEQAYGELAVWEEEEQLIRGVALGRSGPHR